MQTVNKLLPARPGIVLLATAFSFAMASANPVLAQEPPRNERCKAPDQPEKKQGGQTMPPSPGDSRKLSDCGGVLQPPATGDRGMVEEAPSVGNTPVIPPGDMPNNQNNGQDNGQPQSR